MAEAKYVVSTAVVKCKQGSIITTLIGTSKSKIGEKHRVLKKDNKLSNFSTTFGACKMLKNEPCTFSASKGWEEAQDGAISGEGDPCVTTKSFLICDVGGGPITILSDGQNNSLFKYGEGGIVFSGTEKEKLEILNYLNSLTDHTLNYDPKTEAVYIDTKSGKNNYPNGNELIEDLLKSDKTVTIKYGYNEKGETNSHRSVSQISSCNGIGSDSIVFFIPEKSSYKVIDIDEDGNDLKETTRQPHVTLAHELIHAQHSMNGTKIGKNNKTDYVYKGSNGIEKNDKKEKEELRTVGLLPEYSREISGNDIRKEHSLSERIRY